MTKAILPINHIQHIVDAVVREIEDRIDTKIEISFEVILVEGKLTLQVKNSENKTINFFYSKDTCIVSDTKFYETNGGVSNEIVYIEFIKLSDLHVTDGQIFIPINTDLSKEFINAFIQMVRDRLIIRNNEPSYSPWSYKSQEPDIILQNNDYFGYTNNGTIFPITEKDFNRYWYKIVRQSKD